MKTAVSTFVIVLSLAMPGVASAGRASLDTEPADIGPGITLENLHYSAASGERNRVSVSFNGSTTFTVTDTAGITAGRNCTHPNPADSTRVRCVQSSGTQIGTVVVRLGDRNDRAVLRGHGGLVLGGGGSDVLKGSRFHDTLSAGGSATRPARARTRDRISGGLGDDILTGSAGNNTINGGQGYDSISAGRGSDLIKARDSRVDTVRCGGGNDRAILDAADFLADRCARISRNATPAATPVDLFTNGTNAFVVVGCSTDVRVDRCRGSVEITRGRRSFGTRQFNLARGGKVTRAFRLPSDIRRRIGRRGGPRVRVAVSSASGAHLRTRFVIRRRLPPPGD